MINETDYINETLYILFDFQSNNSSVYNYNNLWPL